MKQGPYCHLIAVSGLIPTILAILELGRSPDTMNQFRIHIRSSHDLALLEEKGKPSFSTLKK